MAAFNFLLTKYFPANQIGGMNKDSSFRVLHQTLETLETVFWPNTENRVENTTRSRVILTKFEVFG